MTGDQPTQKTTTEPSAQQKQLLDLAMPGFQQFAAAPPPSAYPGSTVAPFTPIQEKSQQQILGAADTAAGIADWARTGAEALPGTIAANKVPLSSDIFNDPGIWNPAYNAGTTAAIEAAQRPTWQALTEQALPAIRGGAITAGGYGGSRQGLGEGVATGKAFQTASDQAAKIVEDLYGANLGAVQARYGTNVNAGVTQRGQDITGLLATYGLAPSLQQQAFVPGQATAAVGDVQQQQAQNELNAQVAAYYQNLYAPFIKAQQLASVAGSIPGGTTISTANTPQSNPVSTALGGAAVGGTVGGVPGALVGGGLGATLPFLFNRA